MLDKIPALSAGAHKNLDAGACVMEAVAYVAGEPWSDCPQCACPVIGAFLRSWNDALPDEERDTLLRPLISLLIGTRSTQAVERRRATMAADWLVREHTSAWLRLAGLTTHADALNALPEITDFTQCPSLMPVLTTARVDAAAAGVAAWDATRAAAWDATRAAARDAAWAAGVAAWAAAEAAAEAAARDAAEAAAEAAARDAAWAAGVAAWAAAEAALKPTQDALQRSALALVHRMIAVTP